MMNSDTIEIHKTLQELQKELERLSSASQQITEVKEISQAITRNMLVLQEKYQEHLKKLKSDHQKNDEKYKEILNKQLEENNKAHEKLIANTDEKIAKVNSIFESNISKSEKNQDEQKETINEYLINLNNNHKESGIQHKELLNNFLNENKDEYSKLVLHTDKKISEVNEAFESNIRKTEEVQKAQSNLINEHLKNLNNNHKESGIQHKELLINYLNENKDEYSKLVLNTDKKILGINEAFESNIQKTEELQKSQSISINEHLEIYADFVKDVRALTQTIKRVDFPNRLDKLDNTVSAINLGIQNTQTAIVSTDRNITKKVDEQIEKSQSQYKLTGRINNTIKISIWIVGCISILLLLVITYKIFQ